MGWNSRASVTPVFVAAAALSGCVRDTETRWEASASRVCADETCFRVGPLPSGFRVALREAGAVGFVDEAQAAVVSAKATCRDDAEATPLSSLANQLLVGYTERAVRSVETVPMAGREALHTVIAAKLDGMPVILDVYIVKRNGCIFDLTFAAPPARFDAARPAFARFVAGFAPEPPAS